MIKLRLLLTSQALVMEWAKSQFVCQVFLSSEDEYFISRLRGTVHIFKPFEERTDKAAHFELRPGGSF